MKKFLLVHFLAFSIFATAQTGIWGVTSAGGHYNGGTIFKMDASGNNYTIKKSLFQYCGEYGKANLCQAKNGKLYGMTSSCCVFGAYGILFEYDPVTKEFDKLFNFSDTIDGTNPDGAVIQALDGKLYGMTTKGGSHNWGAIFQFDLSTKTYKKLYDLDDKNSGSLPEGNLFQASDGKFYGLTNSGGANDYGVLFQFDPATNAFVKKHDFDGDSTGGNPLGTLIQAKNGKLYGTTASGGTGGVGTIFEFDPLTGIYTKKFDFNGTSNGARPSPSLVEGDDGNLYGTTVYAGANSYGVLFQYVIATGAYNVKFDFDDADNGASSQTALTKAQNGNLYGVTEYGGANNEGVIFEFDPVNSKLTKKFDFSNEKELTGNFPKSQLIQATDGKLYGMSYTGGIGDVGGVFQFDIPSAAFVKQFDFHTSEIGNTAVSSLMYATDKMLYGITQTGGIKNKGTIFQYDPATGNYIKKFEFIDNATGHTPIGGLLQASDGKIYGTTNAGGKLNKGLLFQFDPITNTYKVEAEFDSINGGYPLGELMQASDGKIYGLTREGGASDQGVLFQFDPASAKLIKKYDFKDDGKGKNPEGGLVEGSAGKLIGVTTSGGKNITGNYPDGVGVIFQYELATEKYEKQIDCDSINGAAPNGTLVKMPDGTYYGLATRGGMLNKTNPDGFGTIYQYDPVNATISAKFKFNGYGNGKFPDGSLLLAKDGNLYGATGSGGLANYGVLFQFNPTTGVYTKKLELTKSSGMLAVRCKLIEIAVVNSIAKNPAQRVDFYPNPVKDQVTIVLNEAVENASIKVYTVTGQLVLEKTKQYGTKFQLQIENLAKGTYIVEVTEIGGSSRSKLIKE
ncbi:MAG TPA: choice-of-anchor tandem repeat GloVer-containing protein [Bacteroidia bacterium]|jgi:uncharacterized repeat protein (TIGR03803 family)|nr:choice-of-anchor tandem repeat GloVer-containing protein [Bacteroidia bacterium]